MRYAEGLEEIERSSTQFREWALDVATADGVAASGSTVLSCRHAS